MKIGIDARIYNGTGIARYTRNLIAELERTDRTNEYVIFLNSTDRNSYVPNNPNFKKYIVNAKPFSIEEQIDLMMDFYRADLDLLHVPNFNVPLLYTKKLIVTIHDFTMLEYDNTATNLNEYLYMIKHNFAKLITKASIKKADKIICPTNEIKKEILAKYNINADKISVTYEGGDYDLSEKITDNISSLRRKVETFNLEEDEPYILYVGSTYPHKNLETLILAFKDLVTNKLFTGKLVLAGKIDTFAEHLAAYVYGLKLENKVIFAAKYSEKGILTDTDLAILYKCALCYAFPSKKEGFSLTPLEAQNFGIPVALSNIPVHQEVFGNSVLYFDPDSPSDIFEQLKSIVQSETVRKNLITAGKINALKYSWEDMASKTVSIYQKIGKKV